VQLWSVSGTIATATSSIAVGEDSGVVNLTNFLFSPDGTMGVVGVQNLDSKSASATSLQLTTWEMSSGKQIDRAVPNSGTTDNGLSIAFSPDGKSIVTASSKVEIWDARGSSTPRGTWTAPKVFDETTIFDVQYSHSGKYILAVGVNGVLYLLSATSGKQLATYTPDSLAATSARFLAKDTGIACCGTSTTDNKPCAWLSRFA
jgi:WD40 repeat protein